MRGRSRPFSVIVGVCTWVLLSAIPFASFLGCVVAGYLHRSTPFRDAGVGAITGAAGVATGAMLLLVVDIPAPVEPFLVAAVLVHTVALTALAVYVSIAYIAFVVSFAALLGMIGGYIGSSGYGETKTAQRRAIAFGRKYHGADPAPPTLEELEALEDEMNRRNS